MRILAYKGISPISKAIRWQTRSEFSHIAVELDDGSVVEAWHKGGVQHARNFRENHTAGTRVSAYNIAWKFNEPAAVEWLLEQTGKKYDFSSVFRFMTRRDAPANDKWFCSELAETAMLKGGLRLLNGNPSHHSPRDTVMSPILTISEVLIC